MRPNQVSYDENDRECVQRETLVYFVADMIALLILGSLVAAMPNAMALGSSGSTLVMDQDIPSRTCRYSRAFSMFQVSCSNLGLVEIPSSLKTDIQVGFALGNVTFTNQS